MADRTLSFGANSSAIQYSSGNWTEIDAGGTYLTQDPNATVTFNFNGTLITVVGNVKFDQLVPSSASPVSYVLDGEDNLSFVFNASSETIYSSPILMQGSHTLAMHLAAKNATLSVSGATITTSQAPSDGHHRTTATIIAGTIGGMVLLVVMALALFLFRRRQRRYSSTPYALGPLQATLPATKEAFTSPKYSNHGISFTQSTDSVNVLPLPRVKAPPPALETTVALPRPKRAPSKRQS
ncbi:hypothetical protein B0H10DRAFT_2221627 [Mycena sp. CBHHK59/15]|nr:hypothetical protein B0H10DRAFT_2221627 [Mycena sp. CBHHK59/15]